MYILRDMQEATIDCKDLQFALQLSRRRGLQRMYCVNINVTPCVKLI